ncbi:MAG: DUF1501 domain-containing protein [Candidatus Hydrogenedens sp.]|nr:DUF1501 domain-containing protein [Candidatus Hydrogenedens sp.]
MQFTRRQFLESSLKGMAVFSAAATVPLWISKSAQAATSSLGRGKRLVILQMGGGNDGLNTVIPFQDDLYMGDSLRPNLHITSGFDTLKIDGLNALNPRLAALKTWWDKGRMAVVQNVGYPNPNLSHFTSTDYWERGMSTGSTLQTTQGWLSRYFDNQCAGMPEDQIDPLTMLGAGMAYLANAIDGSSVYRPPAVPDFDAYVLRAPEDAIGALRLDYIRRVNELAAVTPDIDFLQRSASVARASVADMEVASAMPLINAYPDGSLGTGLSMVSKVIRAGFETPVFYVTQSGYDTHANQWDTDPAQDGDHPKLLDAFAGSVNAFLSDMEASGNLDDVMVLTFSEFGRRVAENFSHGTDHGAANSLFVFGGGVKKGVYGGQPDLSDLLIGNLKHRIDFRAVYARVLQFWMGVDPVPILGTTDFGDPRFGIPESMRLIPFVGPDLLGDIDGDGDVNAADIQLTLNAALRRSTASYPTDVTGDGQTTAADIQKVTDLTLGR